MKYLLSAAFLAVVTLAPATAVAGPVERACNDSERRQSNRELCRCIDAAADRTLTRSEQRRAARFFTDPDEAQTVRMSPTRADNEFWARYRAFGALAEQLCTSG
ncbi:hypothetical protein [Pararhodobacter zhoushanensis]|uniref:Secreted protein n=1 Tax=Pararhodobacter zhoushanensis TaxID=2479545 RepID=A0ABT3GV14_9RHOB|nr:hypothetical protein [Pararhodobacter zhoushanensis]MCW1931372.1 hypothetical protein [Pararhodobacter zhoushanensis]